MRKNVNSSQNIWINSGEVDGDDLTLEQNYVNDKLSSIIDNHLGKGSLPDLLVDRVIFNSSEFSGNLDGVHITPTLQPSDTSYGNQLTISLKDSKVFSLRTIKVAVLGLDFKNELIYEYFIFSRNEDQHGKKHFKNILSILINDMLGPSNTSLNLGGDLIITESKPGLLSRDCLTNSQNIQPNLFWRNFYTTSYSTLEGLLSVALPGYDLTDLNIYTTENNVYELAKNDVVTEIGQKFKASSNNIQKIRLLLSVENNGFGDELDLEWEGDLVISVYELQSKITCPSDIVPNLEIEFDPINTPLSQLSLDFSSLKNNGFVLTNSMQPIDFIFSNSAIGNGKIIEKDKYYVFTIKRSGSASKCDIKIYAGQDFTENSRITVFNGNYWSDIQSEDLWYEIYSDSAKIASASIYEDGFGINIEKTIYDDTTGITKDYCLDKLSFYGNSTYTGIVYSKNENFEKIEDKRTGSKVYSKQTKIPSVELLNDTELNSYTSDLLKLGVIADKNLKYKSTNSVSFPIQSWAFVKNQIILPIIEDTSDPRYSTDILSLKSSFLNGEVFKSKITPDLSNPSYYYRVGDAEIKEMIYGDLNGDCIVDESDLELYNIYNSFNLNESPPLSSSIVLSPLSYVNGYKFLTEKSVYKSNVQFYLINKLTSTVVDSAADGILLPQSNSNIYSEFSSASVDFTTNVTSSEDFVIYVSDTEDGNNGYFEISEINSTTDVVKIRKKYLDPEIMLSLYRANINGDFLIDGYDGYLLESFLERNKITSFPTLSYPAPTVNAYNKIGSKFSVLILKLEKFEDTHDDQYLSNRSSTLHEIQDIFKQNISLQDRDFSSLNINSINVPQLYWEDYIITSKSKLKLVPNIVSELTGDKENTCTDSCLKPILFPQELSYDCGVNDQYIPNNLIIGDGQILNKDKSPFKIDFEVGSIIIEVPDNFFGTEKTINIFNSFVCEYNSTGKTIDGFKAMKFADCTYVQSTALNNNQIKFSVSIQSFSPILDGYDIDMDGIIVDPKMGVYIDQDTGLLRLNFTNIYKDLTKPTLSTKIQVNVFIKKAGFNNNTLTLKPELINNLFV